MEVYEKKQGLKELGSYRPAFYKIRLSFPFPSSARPLYVMTDGDMSIFVHEYIHFLQDISSYCLLNNAYCYSEYIHAAVNYIRTSPDDHFEIPLQMPSNLGNVDANLFINKTCFGDNDEVEDLFIIRIEKESELFPYEGVGLRCIDKRMLVTPTKKIHFGYLAIMESMAYIAESQISHPKCSPCDYPYLSAQMVVDKVYPSIGEDVLNVLALCDASLQYSNPGNVFVEMLELMQNRDWLPNEPEDVYRFVYSQQAYVMGREMPIQNALIDMSQLAERSVRSYVTDPRVSPEFFYYVHYLLDYGLYLRIEKPFFMLGIARGGIGMDNMDLISIIQKVGVPIIEDSLQTFHTMLPYGKIFTGVLLELFPAIEQIINCLQDGVDCCEMYAFCEDSERQYKEGLLEEPAPIVTDDCANAPWKRCNDSRLCPYAVLWRLWGLHQKTLLH